ncbi:MAG: urea carboxylase-associated family protein [Solirubrobacteraceae bacterium]|nr:urea carboxylase-associated family protein [Solirubrobacteraceae bacterium]
MSEPRTPRDGAAVLETDLFVPAREARFLEVPAGRILQIVDVEGHQVGDFVAFRAGDRSEYLSPAHTCSCLTKLIPQVGDRLYSNHRTPLLEIEHDDVATHDFVVPCCDAERYSVDYGIHDHPNCRDALQRAAVEAGLDERIRGELAANIFMHNVVTAEGRIETRRPEQVAGAAIDMLVLEDLVVGLVACPQDLSPCNDFDPTSMALRVWRPE